MLLIPLIPHGEVKDDSGKETTLSHSEEKAGREESAIVLRYTE